MKTTGKFLFLLLSLTLVFSLFACGKCEHADEDKDGFCDKCDEELEVAITDVSLIENGVANFQFVIGSDVGSEPASAIEILIEDLTRYGVEVKKVDEGAGGAQDTEVLIGTVKSRGDKYRYDKYSLGSRGYIIKIIDSKILITAGSDKQLASAIEEFGNEILGLAANPVELVDVVMTAAQTVEEIQSNYKVTALKINGVDVRGYTIAADTSVPYYDSAAKFFQNLVYERTGLWLEIVSPDKADKSIIFKSVSKDATVPEGFKVSANDKNQLIIECAYDNMLEEAVSDFITQRIISASGEVELSGEFVTNVSVLCYDDFGAMGDGVTNDFIAIYNTHAKANECGQKVIATAGKTYYINEPLLNGSIVTIGIRTDTDWQGAKIVIDDREITPNIAWRDAFVFRIETDYEAVTVTDSDLLKAIVGTGLNKTTKNLDLKAALGEEYANNPYPVFITLYNSEHKICRRRGYSNYAGTSMSEVVVIDKDGNIDPETTIMWDYRKLTKIEVRRCDDEKITVENCEFTTRAPLYNCIYTKPDGTRDYNEAYLNRGINIRRSNALIKNIKHYVKGEKSFSEQINPDTRKVESMGLPYYGFYRVGYCTDVTLEDCVITGRRCYIRPNTTGTTGTYDLTVGYANRTVFKNCTQSNFWVKIDGNGNIKPAKEGDEGAVLGLGSFPTKAVLDTGKEVGVTLHWGCGGSNYAKNIAYIGCTLSRFDAHDSMYNGKVIDSTVQTVALTGAGEMIIKDTRIFPDDNDPRVFGVRADYGATFDGAVKIDNVSVIAPTKASNGQSYSFFIMEREDYKNWYYGYYTVVPSLEIKDVVFYDANKYNATTKTYTQIPAGTSIYLYGKTLIKADSTFHLPEHASLTSSLAPYYSIEDKDADGYIDEPDYDGDGVWGNTKWLYSEKKAQLGSNYDNGYQDLTSKLNLNKVTPPEFVKILGNAGGYKYWVKNTASGNVSNGGYHGVSENNKGFYGSTKFYYSDTEYYPGPPSTSEKNPDEKYYVFY